MRTIIAGSRTITDQCLVDEAMAECGWVATVVVSGRAVGVDRLGEKWAMERAIPIDPHYAHWHLYGKRAGPIRNEQMAQNAQALVAVWDGKSAGTKHMIECAKANGLRVYVKTVLTIIESGLGHGWLWFLEQPREDGGTMILASNCAVKRCETREAALADFREFQRCVAGVEVEETADQPQLFGEVAA